MQSEERRVQNEGKKTLCVFDWNAGVTAGSILMRNECRVKSACNCNTLSVSFADTFLGEEGFMEGFSEKGEDFNEY